MLIKKISSARFQLISDDGVFQGEPGELRERITQMPDEPLILVFPATAASLHQVTYSELERKLLDKVIPYSLEDDLADRVEAVHFVIEKLPGKDEEGNLQAVVCCVEKDLLQSELLVFNENNLVIDQCIPELCLLPWQAGQWTLVFPGDKQCLIRFDAGQGLACHMDNLALVLQTIMREKSLPTKIRLYVSSTQMSLSQSEVLELLPGLASHQVEITRQDYWQLLKSSIEKVAVTNSSDTRLNLLSGEFAPGLPWRHWWKQWQIAAILLLAIASLDLISRVIEISRLENLSQQLTVETEEIFRQVNPQGALIDAQLQLERQLQSLQGNSGSGFVALLDRAAPVIMNNPQLQVQNLNYSDRDREIQMTLITSDFNTAESIRARLQSLGLQAELIGSTSSAQGNRSRLRIGS